VDRALDTVCEAVPADVLDMAADIFPIDISEGCKSLPSHEVRRFSSIPVSSTAARVKRNSFSYSRSLSFGSPRNPLSHSPSTAILFKDSRGLPAVQPLRSPAARTAGCIEDDILNFFKCYKCYELIPQSAKLVVLDTRLTPKKAFLAMVETAVRACPLWDSGAGRLAGVLSLADLLALLHRSSSSGSSSLADNQELERGGLVDWREEKPGGEAGPAVSPDHSLHQAVSRMVEANTTRIPIIDPGSGNVLYLLGQRALLRFLFQYVPNLAFFHLLSQSIEEAGVGTFQGLQVASPSSSVREAVARLVTGRVAALPVLDQTGRLAGVFSQEDVVTLAAQDPGIDLALPLAEAVQLRPPGPAHCCSGDDSVLGVAEQLLHSDTGRLVVTAPAGQVRGIVAVSDIIRYLVSRHLGRAGPRARQMRGDSIGEEGEEGSPASPPRPAYPPPGSTPGSPPPAWFMV